MEGGDYWKGSVSEFIELLRRDPEVLTRATDNASARLDRPISVAGIGSKKLDSGEEIPTYDYFRRDMFDKDAVISNLMNIIKSAAAGNDIGKRIILLVGPPGAGKSTIARMLREALDGVRAFAIKDCPWHENPLKAVPKNERKRLEEELNISGVRRVKGDLCAWCAVNYEGKDWRDLPVEEYALSERERRGITFVGTTRNPQDVDISELVGSYDISRVKFPKSDPRSYDCGGALFYGNNGILEVIEWLKLDAKFHQVFLTVCEEREVKIERFSSTNGLDLVIVAHTNEEEYKRFLSDRSAEGLHRRVIVVEVAHVLNWKSEKMIYEKLLRENALSTHFSPHLLEAVAKLAVLTRYAKDDKVEHFDKLRLYADEEIKDRNADIQKEDVVKMGREKREGMFGVAPTTVIDALNIEMAQPGRKCVWGLDFLEKLKDFLKSGDATRQDRPREVAEGISKWIDQVADEYSRKVEDEVYNCLTDDNQPYVKGLFKGYLDNAMAYFNGEEDEKKEKAMRLLEELIGISESQKDDWRSKTLAIKGALPPEEQFNLDNYPSLNEAIETKLKKDLAPTMKLVFESQNLTEKDEKDKTRTALVARLIKKGYCDECAQRAVDEADDRYRENES